MQGNPVDLSGLGNTHPHLAIQCLEQDDGCGLFRGNTRWQAAAFVNRRIFRTHLRCPPEVIVTRLLRWTRRRWHQPGGYRELLKVAVPLVLGSASISIQAFVDRLFLTWYSPTALVPIDF